MITLDLNKSSGLLDLTKAAPNFKTIRGVLNWDPHPVHARSLTQGFDLDIFAYVLNGSEKITSGEDVAFFNNKTPYNSAVSIPLDNRTGEGDDDEYIDVTFSKLPADKQHVDIYVFIHDAQPRGQNFGMMANSSFVLSDADSKVDLVKYKLSDFTTETALHIGRFSKTNDGWTFQPIGQGGQADPNQVVGAYYP